MRGKKGEREGKERRKGMGKRIERGEDFLVVI